MSLKKTMLMLSAAMVVAVTSGCAATNDIVPADRFAYPGAIFASSIPPAIDESFALTVRLDSYELASVRPELTKRQRLTALEVSNEMLAERLSVLRDIKTHSLALKGYFLALELLLQDNAPFGIGKSTNELTAELGSLSSSIKAKLDGVSAGGRPLSDFIREKDTVNVSETHAPVFKKEFETNGKAIEKELRFVAGLFGFLSAMARDQIDALEADETQRQIDRAYLDDGSLPPDWATRREILFKTGLELDNMEKTKSASEAVWQSFRSLISGHLSSKNLSYMMLFVVGEQPD